MDRVRPTLRVLREDLKFPIPPATTSLDEIDHPLLAKATEQFADPDTGHERIRAIDDLVLFKTKVGRWRGAVWLAEAAAEPRTWLVAGGIRESGSPDDFYKALETDAKAARARYNSEHRKPVGGATHAGHLMPTIDDQDRYRAEVSTRVARQLRAVLLALVRGSLRDGHEHAASFPGYRLGILVRADDGHETYLAVNITGKPPRDLIKAVLRLVPGCDPKTWYLETAAFVRDLEPNEQLWSNLMDPIAAAQLLDEDEADTAL